MSNADTEQRLPKRQASGLTAPASQTSDLASSKSYQPIHPLAPDSNRPAETPAEGQSFGTSQNFNLDFSILGNPDVLENFDFDSFLNKNFDLLSGDAEVQRDVKDPSPTSRPFFNPSDSPELALDMEPEYTDPGAYFSPLASPALEGQQSKQPEHSPWTDDLSEHIRIDAQGVPWLSFDWSFDRIKTAYTIRCDIEKVDVSTYPYLSKMRIAFIHVPPKKIKTSTKATGTGTRRTAIRSAGRLLT